MVIALSGVRQETVRRRRHARNVRADAESANMHITIAVSYATGETLGSFPDQGNYTRAGSWVMETGKSSAHIRIPGR